MSPIGPMGRTAMALHGALAMASKRQLWFGIFSMAAFGGLLWPTQAQDQQANMITPATQEAIDRGLKFLADRQNVDGSFGSGQHQGNVAITSLAGLAFMAGGHQPGRGKYGLHVT